MTDLMHAHINEIDIPTFLESSVMQIESLVMLSKYPITPCTAFHNPPDLAKHNYQVFSLAFTTWLCQYQICLTLVTLRQLTPPSLRHWLRHMFMCQLFSFLFVFIWRKRKKWLLSSEYKPTRYAQFTHTYGMLIWTGYLQFLEILAREIWGRPMF